MNNHTFLFSVDDRYRAELLFQIYWLLVNTIMVAFIEIWLYHDMNLLEMKKEVVGFKNHTLLACLIFVFAVASILQFSVQRHDKLKKASLIEEQEGEIESFKTCCFEIKINSISQSLLDRALEECKKGGHFQIVKCFGGCIDFAASLVDYGSTLNLGLNYLSSGHTIWGVLTLVIQFLPGIEWHSQRDLRGCHRLTWFLSSFFFPLTVMGSRVSTFYQCMNNSYF